MLIFFPIEGFSVEWIPNYFEYFNIILLELKMMG